MTAEPWAGADETARSLMESAETAPKGMLTPCLAGATAVPTLSHSAHGRGGTVVRR